MLELETKSDFGSRDGSTGIAADRDRFCRRPWKLACLRPGFNLQMACAAAVLLLFTFPGLRLTQIHVSHLVTILAALAVMVAGLFPLIAFLGEKGRQYWVDLIVTTLWVIFFTYALNFPVVIFARLGANTGLQDAHLAQIDRSIGLTIPSIVAWASHNPIGRLASACYFPLINFMRLAILLPLLAGKARSTQRFLRANLIAFAIGLPLFALVPAVGPWYGYPLPPRPDQNASQTLLLLFRSLGPCEFHIPAGIVCFPSFHVIWSILALQALWVFRVLRIPATVFTALIILSTVTTGEHYLIDLVAGAVVATAAMIVAERLSRLSDPEPLLPDSARSQ
jgi:hypothetical protein